VHGLWTHGSKGDATDEDVPCDSARLEERVNKSRNRKGGVSYDGA